MGVLILLIITFMIMWFLAGVFTATHFDQQRRFRHWSVLTVFFPIFVPIVVIICQDIYASQHPHYTSYKTVIDLGALTQWIGAVVGSFLLSILIAFFEHGSVLLRSRIS